MSEIKKAETQEEGLKLYNLLNSEDKLVISKIKDLWPCMESWPCQHGILTVYFVGKTTPIKCDLSACAAKSFFDAFENRGISSHLCNCPNCNLASNTDLKEAQKHFKKCCYEHSTMQNTHSDY